MVIGFGDLARRLLPKLQGLAHVTGVSRRPEILPDALTTRLYGDYGVPGSLRDAAALKPDYVVFTPVPSGRNIDGGLPPRSVGFDQFGGCKLPKLV